MTAPRVVVVGSTNLDLIVSVPSLPGPGATVIGGDAVSRLGGKGANQAVAAHQLGADTTFVSAIGEDPFGDTLCAALDESGLPLAGVQRIGAPSGLALIFVDPAGENVITVSPGANSRLRPEHLAPAGAALAADAVLLLQLEIPVGTARAAATLARTAGARTILNAAPVPARPNAELSALVAATDVLVVNEVEARALLGAAGADADDAAGWGAVASRLRDLGPAAVVVTLGARGAVLADTQGSVSVPSLEVRTIDTTGAGDAFCGALAVALALGTSLRTAVEQGCRAGALATTYVGAQAPSPLSTLPAGD